MNHQLQVQVTWQIPHMNQQGQFKSEDTARLDNGQESIEAARSGENIAGSSLASFPPCSHQKQSLATQSKVKQHMHEESED